MILLSVVGYQNSGKTTFIRKLVQRCNHENIKVAVIKHHGHSPHLSTEQLSKDTGTHLQSGSHAVVGLSKSHTECFIQESIPLETVIHAMETLGIQVLLLEGFKRESYSKVLLLRHENDHHLLTELENIQHVYEKVGNWENNNELDTIVITLLQQWKGALR